MNTTAKADHKVIFALFLVHFIGDFYCAFVNPLLPVLADKLSLTMTQLGFVAGISRITAFIIQPSVGYLADRYQTRFFILGGPLIAALFIPLLGVANSFWLVLLFVSLGSFGSSMFHPPAAGMVPLFAGRHIGLSMSLFNLGGTAAFGIGPFFVAWYVSRFHLPALPFSSVVGVLAVLVLFLLVPKPESEGMRKLGFIGSLKDTLGPIWRPISLIWVLIVFRTFVSQSFMTFGPVLFSREGYSLVGIGGIISAYTVAGALSGVVAGHLADRIGYKPIFYATYALATPALYLFLILPGQWKFVGAFLAGFVVLATMPLAVAMAQEMTPRGRSLMASLMMGLAFGTGGLLTPITGRLADLFSIRAVLGVVLWVPLLATALVYRLPGRPRDAAAA